MVAARGLWRPYHKGPYQSKAGSKVVYSCVLVSKRQQNQQTSGIIAHAQKSSCTEGAHDHQTDATYDGAFEATANIKEGPELEAVYLFYIQYLMYLDKKVMYNVSFYLYSHLVLYSSNIEKENLLVGYCFGAQEYNIYFKYTSSIVPILQFIATIYFEIRWTGIKKLQHVLMLLHIDQTIILHYWCTIYLT